MPRVSILLITIIIGASGCLTSPQPYLSKATMVPDNLKPGDTALITVEVFDRLNLVESVTGIVMEDKTINFRFRDDGTQGDVEADDDIWSMKVDVPFNAPPGGFTFEISAFDVNENLIIVRDENNEAAGMTTSFTLDITYPDAEASKDAAQ